MNRGFVEGVFENLLKVSGLNTKSTMLDLFNHSNIELNVFTTNLTTFKLERLSYKTTPDLMIIEAVYRSCSLPFIFQPSYEKESCYVDGGVINPYPMNICLEDFKKENTEFDTKEILGFKIVDDALGAPSPSSSIFHFGFYMIYRLIKENYNYVTNEPIEYELIIPSDILSIDAAQNIITSSDERKKLIGDGEKYAKLFLSYIMA